jgi:adenylate cyclase
LALKRGDASLPENYAAMATQSGIRKFLQTCAPTGAALLLVGLLGAVGALGSLDRAWFDFLQRKTARFAPVPEDTALVMVDEESMRVVGGSSYGYRWPWPRDIFAAMLAGLHQAGAKAVVVDMIFLEGSEDPMKDAILGAVAAGLPEVTLGAMPPRGGKPETLPAIWPKPMRSKFPVFFSGRTRWGYVRSLPDDDSVIRRYGCGQSLVESALGRPSEGAETTARLVRWRGALADIKVTYAPDGPVVPARLGRGVPVVPVANFISAGKESIDRLNTRLMDALSAAPDGGQPELYELLDPAEARQIVEAAPPQEDKGIQDSFAQVRGRTVFVGSSAAATFDLVATPCGAPEPGVMLHWTAHASYLSTGFIRETGPVAAGAALAAIMALLGWVARAGIGIWRPALVAGGGVVLALGGSAAAFLGNVWFAPMLPVAGTVAGFGAAAVQSFLLERARKKEIQGWFGSYVSPAVVKQLVQNPDSLKLGGEKRELTIFFADLANFTTLSESMPPEELVPLINSVLEELTEGVLAHGCYVDKYIGDAIMGVFGSPEPLENHALSACRAALESMRRLDKLNERIERTHGRRLGMRIGVNTGDAIVGNVGSTKKRNYTVLGDAVNLASRLEGANKEFHTGILIGPKTAAQLGGALVTRPVAQLKVKGKKQAVEVHELLGEPDMLDEGARRFLAAYGEGYTAYCQRRFAEACRAFAIAATLRPDDFLATRYAEETQRLADSPPPSDWEPILELHSK